LQRLNEDIFVGELSGLAFGIDEFVVYNDVEDASAGADQRRFHAEFGVQFGS
jgi:hypothetical protein